MNVRTPSRCVGAADVEPMRDIDGECDKPAFGKDRTNDCEITGMGAAAKRVVRYNHATGKIDAPNRSITLRICAPNVPVKSVIPLVWAISSPCALRVR
jgi:hypothetical protein